MVKDSKKKAKSKTSAKYTSLDDESSDEFKGLSRDQVVKVNELIKVVNEKDELLENRRI